jgi:cyclic pyranopterin phosphate synthase
MRVVALRDLRISVTDRCNFRCSYCMPKEVFDDQHHFLPHASLLSFEEITRTAAVFVRRRAQAAPDRRRALLRRQIEQLIAQLSALRTRRGRRWTSP